uniref:Uncharacterized protein n=1 Tax=uncultured prokaryote TaxID=198431 RepID=A0A0H5Q5R4_9ZZZZ|nr:hypothetical protein [uncultured prokaryote]
MSRSRPDTPFWQWPVYVQGQWTCWECKRRQRKQLPAHQWPGEDGRVELLCHWCTLLALDDPS